MTTYRLTYFDVDGGRAEPIRIALHKAGIKFEDHRVSFPQFLELRGSLRFGAMPVLEIDGKAVTQSNAICHFVGKLAGLYPADDLQALYCDEALGGVEDALHAIVPTLGLQGDELRFARQKLVEGRLPVYVRGLGQILERGGNYVADNRLTIADLKLYFLTRWLSSGALDHVPVDLVQRTAPNLVDHENRIAADPVVKAYYASRR